MSRKKSPPAQVPPGGNFVRLQLSDECHKRLRVKAAELNVSMAALARAIVHEAIMADDGVKK